jgi:hypothetical protein
MNAGAQTTKALQGLPVLVGESSCVGQGNSPVEFEMRVRLTPAEAKLLRRLPIVGACVRSWRVPVSNGDWRPHPTMAGAEIEFFDA